MSADTVAHVVVEVDHDSLNDPVVPLRADRPVVYLGWTGKDRDAYLEELLAGRSGPPALRGHLVRGLPSLYEQYPRTTPTDRARQRTKLAEKLVRRGYRPWGLTLRRVYVGRLDPADGDDRPRVYVGESSKPATDRWEEHLSGARTEAGTPKFSRVVHRHGQGLAPELYERYPPVVSRDTAEELERQVAHQLLHRGYRVEGNGITNPPTRANFVETDLPQLLEARRG